MTIAVGFDFLSLLPWIGMTLALLSLWGALHARRLYRLLTDTPTSKTIGVFLGMVEVKGTAETEQPVIGELSGKRCVYYTWNVQERWSRIVTETYTDSKGRTQTRTRTEAGWTTVASGSETLPFYLKDDRGIIRIVPDKAKIEPLTTFSRTCRPHDSLYYDKAPRAAIANSDHVRSFTEQAIPLHTPLYVFGMARQREDIVAAEIASDRDAPMFVISTREKKAIKTGKAVTYWSLAILGLLLTVAGWIAPDLIEYEHFNTPLALKAASGFLAAWLLCWAWMVYNSIARLNQRVNNAWSHIDVELRRRHDLIPQLERVVKGMRDFERQVQEEITHLRTQMQATAPGESGPDPEACAGDVKALAEAYPELKANENFLALQKELTTTEERIALARTYYNDIAAFFSMRLNIVPDRYIAKLGSFREHEFMRAEGFERATPDVQLAE